MKVLLAWLVDFAWILYAACGLGAFVYVVRAVSVQRRLRATLTQFERDVLSARANRLWGGALGFIAVGAALFALQAYVLPRAAPDLRVLPTPTVEFGLVTPTPSPSPTPSPTPRTAVTLPPTVPPPPPPTPEPTVEPTPTQISVPGVEPAVVVGAQFADVAELLGYDLLSDQVTPEGGVTLTLYWRALEGAPVADYVVFTHLLTPDGRLIAQHDGVPNDGTQPTTTWTPGAVIVDPHVLVFNDEGRGYSGGAQLAVGLYLSGAPQARVALVGGGDFVLLPTPINVLSP